MGCAALNWKVPVTRENEAMPTPVLASIGDHGVLNATLSDEQSQIWIDRDFSWLDFNDRVLAEALDDRTPLLERAKFLAIFTSNLDEFFMKRFAILCQAKSDAERALFHRLREKLLPMLATQAECFRKTIIPGLAANGVFLRRWDELTHEQQHEASAHFDTNVSRRAHPAGRRSGASVSVSFESLHVAGLSSCTTLSAATPCMPGSKCPRCCRSGSR